MKTLAGRPLILMRPGEANNRLAARLESAGGEVWRWPAFAIRLPDETELLERRLANLSDVEMVVLPSPSSVAAVAHWVRRWPDHVVLATVGEGTARAIRAAWGEDVRLLYPEGEAERVKALLTYEMEHAAELSLPLTAEAHAGRSWAQAKG